MEKLLSYLLPEKSEVIKFFYSFKGFILWILLAAFSALQIKTVDIEYVWVVRVSIFLIFILCYLILWISFGRLSKFHQNKMGILFSVWSETEVEAVRLKNDFLSRLKGELINSKNGERNVFNLKEVPDWRIPKQKDDKWEDKILNKTKGVLLIYGYCKRRQGRNGAFYILQINARIRVPSQRSSEIKKFQNEFQENFGRKFLIDEKSELLGFEITADTIYGSTIYVTALLELLRYNFKSAYELLKSLYEQSQQKDLGFTKTLLLEKIKKLLPEVAINYTSQYYEMYRSSPGMDWNPILDVLNFLKQIGFDSYKEHLLWGVYFFQNGRQIDKAIEEIEKARNNLDFTWCFSLAFLFAYKGDLGQANELYKKANRKNYSQLTINQVEDFLTQVLEVEPDKKQLWFCLGVINLFIKGDKSLALSDFKNFLDSNSGNQHPLVIAKVRKWIEEFDLE